MKTKLRNVLILVLGLLWSGFIAGINPEITMIPAGNKSFTLHLISGNEATYTIHLVDVKGTILLSDRVKRYTNVRT